LVDSEFGVNITLSGALPSTTDSQDILEGSMIVARTADSPSGNVVKDASNVVLAKYELKAYGEPIKVETLTVDCTTTRTAAADVTLRNGRLYVDGTQVGSTRNIVCVTGTSYPLGSSLIVNPGEPKILEVRADIYDSEGTNNATSGEKIKVILKEGISNAQAQNSLNLVDVPSADKEGYELTVAVGGLTGDKSAAYGDQSTVAGVSAFKLGQYVLTAGAGESVDISRFTVGVTTSDALSKISNLYVKYGGETTSPKGTISSSNSFSVSYNLPANEQLVVEVYADLASTLETDKTVTTTLAVSARGHDTGTDVGTDLDTITGQTINIVTPTITASLDPSRPDPAIVIAEDGDVALAKYKFEAQYADIGINDLKVVLASSTAARSLVMLGLDYNNDGVPDEERYVTGATTTFTSSFTVSAGTKKTVGILADIGAVTTDKDNSGDDAQIVLYGYHYVISGVENTTSSLAVTSTSQIIRNTKPTISGVGIASTNLGNGTKELIHFTITADSHDDVTWTTTTFEIVLNDSTVASTTDASLNLRLTNIKIVDSAGNVLSGTSTAYTTSTSKTVTITLGPKSGRTELAIIPKGEPKTYKLIADVAGAADDDSVSTKLTGLRWSDQVATNIDETYIIGIPTDLVSMSQ